MTVRAVLSRLRAVSLFFENLVRVVYARATVEWRSRKMREMSAAAREEKIETAPIAGVNEFFVRLTTENTIG